MAQFIGSGKGQGRRTGEEMGRAGAQRPKGRHCDRVENRQRNIKPYEIAGTPGQDEQGNWREGRRLNREGRRWKDFLKCDLRNANDGDNWRCR